MPNPTQLSYRALKALLQIIASSTVVARVENFFLSFDLSAVEAANVPRIVWIAPIGSDEHKTGPLLAQAESMARAYPKPITIVRHGILFSQLLHHREEIRGRHTLSLPLPDQALLWVAAEALL